MVNENNAKTATKESNTYVTYSKQGPFKEKATKQFIVHIPLISGKDMKTKVNANFQCVLMTGLV